MIRMKKMIRS